MIYKYSDNYDEIVDIEADMDFIRNFFALMPQFDYNILKNQLRSLYEVECNNHKYFATPDKEKQLYNLYEEELRLCYLIQNRAYKLIEKVGVEYLSKSYSNPSIRLVEHFKDMIKSYDNEIIENTISILESCIFILNNKKSNVIFDKERDIKLYQHLLLQLTSIEPEIKEKGKQKLFSLVK